MTPGDRYAEQWQDFLLRNGLICPDDCCATIRARGQRENAQAYNSAGIETKREAKSLLKFLLAEEERGLTPIWDEETGGIRFLQLNAWTLPMNYGMWRDDFEIEDDEEFVYYLDDEGVGYT